MVVDQASLYPDPDPSFLENPEVFMTKYEKNLTVEKKIQIF
jgi:hypothetical protein